MSSVPSSKRDDALDMLSVCAMRSRSSTSDVESGLMDYHALRAILSVRLDWGTARSQRCGHLMACWMIDETEPRPRIRNDERFVAFPSAMTPVSPEVIDQSVNRLGHSGTFDRSRSLPGTETCSLQRRLWMSW